MLELNEQTRDEVMNYIQRAPTPAGVALMSANGLLQRLSCLKEISNGDGKAVVETGKKDKTIKSEKQGAAPAKPETNS